jgi:hypothetical protein
MAVQICKQLPTRFIGRACTFFPYPDCTTMADQHSGGQHENPDAPCWSHIGDAITLDDDHLVARQAVRLAR